MSAISGLSAADFACSSSSVASPVHSSLNMIRYSFTVSPGCGGACGHPAPRPRTRSRRYDRPDRKSSRLRELGLRELLDGRGGLLDRVVETEDLVEAGGGQHVADVRTRRDQAHPTA